MKNKIIIFLSSFFIFICIIYSSNNVIAKIKENSVDSSENLYILEIQNKTVVVNDKNKIIYKQNYQNESIEIIKDDFDKKPSLVKVVRWGESQNEPDYYDYYNAKKTVYIDKTGDIINIETDEDYINYIYNNYAIINNYDDQSYDEAEIFDLNNKQFLENTYGFNVIVKENDILFGKKLVPTIDSREYEYYILDDNLNVIRKITRYEYEDLNGKDYEDCIYTDNGIIIGIKHDKKYILDENRKALSEGYICDGLFMANFTSYGNHPLKNKYDYNDIIFCRIKDNQMTYFTLEKDIYTKTIYDKYDYDRYGNVDMYWWDGSNVSFKDNYIYGREYSLDESFVVGENNCYAILDKEKYNAYIYSLHDDKVVATLSSIVDLRNNEEYEMKYRNIYYIENIYLYGRYVICDYNDIISNSHFKFINAKNGFGSEILGKERINILNEKKFVRETYGKPYQYVVDVESETYLKTLYNKYIDMQIFENNGKYIIALQKEYTIDKEYQEFFDLYDVDFNLLYANVGEVSKALDMLYFESYELNKGKGDSNLYTIKKTIINFDKEILFECYEKNKSGVDLFLLGNGIIVKRYSSKDTSGKIKSDYDYLELFDSRRKKIVNIPNITNYEFYENDNDNILFIYTKEKTYVYNFNGKKFTLKKIINEPLEDYYYREKNGKKYYIMINSKNNLYTLLDDDFNIIGENYRFIHFYNDEYYYYIDGSNVYISDYNDVKVIINYYQFVNDDEGREYEDY